MPAASRRAATASKPPAPRPKSPSPSTGARPAGKAAAPAAVAAPASRAAAKAGAASPSSRAAAPAGAAAGKTGKKDKERKPKLKRDSFTIPKDEFAVLEALKQRAARGGAPSKKSEVLRAGIKALAAMPDAAFLAAMSAVPSLKTGRPAKG